MTNEYAKSIIALVSLYRRFLIQCPNFLSRVFDHLFTR